MSDRPTQRSQAFSDIAEAHAMQRRVERMLPHLRRRLAPLEPAEIMAVLGQLTVDVLSRVRPDARMAATASWTELLTISVRRSLG